MPTPTNATPVLNSEHITPPSGVETSSIPSSPRRIVEIAEPPSFCCSIQISPENVKRFCNLLCLSPGIAAGVQELRLGPGPVYISLRRLSELLSLFPELRSLRLRHVIFLNVSSDIRVPSEVLNQLAPHRHPSKRSLEELDIRSCRFKSPQTQVYQLISMCAPHRLFVHSPKKFHKSRGPSRRARPSLEQDSTETSASSRVLRFVNKLRSLATSESDEERSEPAFYGMPIQPSLQRLILSRVNEKFMTLLHESVKCTTLKELTVYRAHDGLGRYISDAAWYLIAFRLNLDASRFPNDCCDTAARGVAFCTQLSTLTFRVNLCSERTFVWSYIATIIACSHPSIKNVVIQIARWNKYFDFDSEDAHEHGQTIDAAIAKHQNMLESVEFLWAVEKQEDEGPSEEMIEAIEKWLPRTNETELLRMGIVFAA